MQVRLISLLIVVLQVVSCSKDILEPSTMGSIRGVIVDTLLDPVANVTISTDPPTSQIFSSADGRFEITDVIPGVYVIEARRNSVETATAQVRVLAGKASTANITITAFALGEGMIKGRVIDERGAPLAGAVITTQPITTTTTSDSNGIFLLAHIKEREYTLRAVVEQRPMYAQLITVLAGKVSFADVTIRQVDSLGFGALVAFYPFEQTGEDFSGAGRNLKLSGATFTQSRFGDGTSALYANATMATGPHDEKYNASAISVSLWVKVKPPPIAQEQGMFIVSHYAITSANGFTLFFVGPDIEWLYGDGGHVTYCRVKHTPLTDDRWHSVIAMATGTGSALYFDGEKVATGTGGGVGIPSQMAQFEIGDISPLPNAAGKPLLGAVDDVRIYNKILSDEEIQRLVSEK